MPRFGTGSGPSPVQLPLVSLLNVMFVLAIFFVLNLEVLAPPKNFNVNMPLRAPAADNAGSLSEIKVKLEADADGNLAQLVLGDKRLGRDDRAFERLNAEILKRIPRPGAALPDSIEVEIDADYDLRYEHVLRAVSTCTGRQDAQGNAIRYVEKIKFAPPRKKA